MLYDFLAENRAEIIARCRAKVAARSTAQRTQLELEYGAPLFLDQLAEILRLDLSSSPRLLDSAARHGDELFRMGCSVAQVVHEYGDICRSVTELALERGAPIITAEFHVLNRCLDDAIARAVTEYDHQRAQRISKDGTERHGVFVHELRNLLGTAILSFEVLRMGGAGVEEPTGLLGRSLSRLRDFVDRSLASVRLEAALESRERIAMAEFLEEIEGCAALEAHRRGLHLTVWRAEGDVAIEGDRQVLASIVANLLQNAFKFTRPEGHVSLRSFADADRVLIEVQDECGGLPPGDPNALFLPFEQRGNDRTGMGLGLAISRRGVEASGGVLHVRDLPGAGCVFTVELPRSLRESSVAVAAVPLTVAHPAVAAHVGPVSVPVLVSVPVPVAPIVSPRLPVPRGVQATR